MNISRHPYIVESSPNLPLEDLAEKKDDAIPVGSEDILSNILYLLRSSFGVDFSLYKRTTINRRILRRMALYRQEKLEDYLSYLQDYPTEVEALYREILIHVTSFFRDASAFDALKQEVFPALLRDRAAESPIRVWVAGCSTGEEAYSIAICLLEFLATQPRRYQIQILATDVSEIAIEKARKGIYSLVQVESVSAERLQHFFVPVEGGFQIAKSAREVCIFARQNLMSDPPFSHMDLISCRNVLIYFSAALQKRALSHFHYGLQPSGFLLLGASETVGDFSSLFHLLDRRHKLYAKKPATFSPMELSGYRLAPTALPIPHSHAVREEPLFQAVDRLILSEYAPSGVVANAQLDIVQFRGRMGIYLEPSAGQASLNLLGLVKEALRPDLRAAIHQVQQEGKSVCRESIQFRDGDRMRSIRVEVVPIDLPGKPSSAAERYFLILFTEKISAAGTAGLKRTKRSQDESLQIEQELESTRSYLRSLVEEQQATNQDLRAANEEILSSNEELQSTNEELQTAKEEIQATNEELNTINDELYRRNAEAMQVSNDFQNLLGSINIPIVMLASDLRIRRFTPTASSLFNLIATDIGRPLSDIKHNLNLPDLEAQILEVIDRLTPKALEVQDRQGRWYDLRIRPYRTLDNRIDGAVVVLVEIDVLKHSAERLQEARDYAEAIVQTVRESLVVLNADLRVVSANRHFYETFAVSPLETEGVCIFELGNGQWNIPSLRLLLEEMLVHNVQIDDFQVEHDFERIGHKAMMLNARVMMLVNGDRLTLLAIEDISG